MAKRNPYDTYSNNSLFTAPREELTLKLYEGALKFTNQAITAIDSKELIKGSDLIIKVQDIIREFQMTLDMKYEISAQLNSMYDYIHNLLVEGNMKKDQQMLCEARDLIREMRDTWKEAMLLAKQA